MPDHHVFAVASGKGGVGKTTTAVNLGAAAAATGRSAVVVDADLGMANVTDFLAVEPAGATLHDALAGGVDAPAAAISAPGGLDVVPGSPPVEAFSDADPANLPDAVAALRERYDVVILDVGAGLSHDTVVPLGVADGVVVVTTPQRAAVRDAKKTMELAERFGGEVAGVLVVDRGDAGGRTPAEVADALNADLLAAVPESPAVPESAAEGVPLREYAPEDPATCAYRDAAARLLGDEPSDDEAGDGESDGVADTAEPTAPTAPMDPDEVAGDVDAGESAAESSGDEAESSGDAAADAAPDDAGEGVVIEDAESGLDGDAQSPDGDVTAEVETMLDGVEIPEEEGDSVPDDAMPTNLPGTDEDGDSGGDGSTGSGDGGDDDTGWLSRLTGGRLG